MKGKVTLCDPHLKALPSRPCELYETLHIGHESYVHSVQLHVYFKCVLWVPACSTLKYSNLAQCNYMSMCLSGPPPPLNYLNRPLNRRRNMATTTVGELPIMARRDHCRLLERYVRPHPTVVRSLQRPLQKGAGAHVWTLMDWLLNQAAMRQRVVGPNNAVIGSAG